VRVHRDDSDHTMVLGSALPQTQVSELLHNFFEPNLNFCLKFCLVINYLH
jgi:hypothetical protein